MAAEPLLGHMYYFGKERYSGGGDSTQQEMLYPGKQHAVQFHTIHSTLGMLAPDELRQRVAWSMSQVPGPSDVPNAEG